MGRIATTRTGLSGTVALALAVCWLGGARCAFGIPEVSTDATIRLTALGSTSALDYGQTGSYGGTLAPGYYLFQFDTSGSTAADDQSSASVNVYSTFTLNFDSPVGPGFDPVSQPFNTINTTAPNTLPGHDDAQGPIPFHSHLSFGTGYGSASASSSSSIDASYTYIAGQGATEFVGVSDVFALSSNYVRPGTGELASANGQSQWNFEFSTLHPTAFHVGTVVFKSIALGYDGSSQSAARGPSQITTSGGFEFDQSPSDAWIDPPSAHAFSFQMLGTSLFTRITDFPAEVDSDNRFDVIVDGQKVGTFSPGQSADFIQLLGHGVSSFSIAGIDPAVDGGNFTAFPVQLAFDTPMADFTMTAVTPEPSSTVALVAAIAGCLIRPRSVRSKP